VRFASSYILSAACLALIGCKTATGVKPVTVEVRDGDTHRPVEGASVLAGTAHLFVPYDPSLTKLAGWFDRNPRERTFATTDAVGAATLDIVQGCPVKVVIARAGYEPFETILGGHPMSWETNMWIDPDEALGSSAGPRLQARFVVELSRTETDQ
jgi:hypothetical protein